MQVHAIHNLSNSAVINILEKGLELITDSNIIKNYHPDYKNENCNLFYILKHGRYRENHGKYFILENDNKLISCAGWNEYDDLSSTVLVLTRMYVSPAYRTNYTVGNYILPKVLSDTLYKYQHIWMTVNHYNRTIYTWFEKNQNKKTATLFKHWPEIYKNFIPIGEKVIYNTPQLVVEYKGNKNDR